MHANVLCKNGAQLGRSNRSPVLPAAPVRSYVALSAPPPSSRAGTNFPTTRTQRPVPSRPVSPPLPSPAPAAAAPPPRCGEGCSRPARASARAEETRRPPPCWSRKSVTVMQKRHRPAARLLQRPMRAAPRRGLQLPAAAAAPPPAPPWPGERPGAALRPRCCCCGNGGSRPASTVRRRGAAGLRGEAGCRCPREGRREGGSRCPMPACWAAVRRCPVPVKAGDGAQQQ